jgi:hypothetical protein
MAVKFYYAENAGSRKIAGEQFEVTDICAGVAHGVFVATTQAQIALLDAQVANPLSAVTSITAEEYAAIIKKKAPNLSSWPVSTQSVPAGMRINDRAGVVVAEAPLVDRSEQERMESPEQALAPRKKPKA